MSCVHNSGNIGIYRWKKLCKYVINVKIPTYVSPGDIFEYPCLQYWIYVSDIFDMFPILKCNLLLTPPPFRCVLIFHVSRVPMRTYFWHVPRLRIFYMSPMSTSAWHVLCCIKPDAGTLRLALFVCRRHRRISLNTVHVLPIQVPTLLAPSGWVGEAMGLPGQNTRD